MNKQNEESLMKIIPPTECPSCGSALEFENSVLYCRNKGCPAQSSQRIKNFAAKMKILGLGPKAIELLQLKTISDVYSMSRDYYVSKLGVKIGEKVHDNVLKSQTASLNQIIASAGIPLVGKTAADKICSKVANIQDLLNNESMITETLGPKTGLSLISWLEVGEWRTWPFSFNAEKVKELSGKTVCITGRLKSFKTKAEAGKFLEGLGYRVMPNVTRKLDILVNESGIESTKTTKARENGTQIITNIMELE